MLWGSDSNSSLKSKVELLSWLQSIRVDLPVVQTVCLKLLLGLFRLPPPRQPRCIVVFINSIDLRGECGVVCISWV